MGRPVRVGLPRHRGDVQARVHLDGERHALAGQPSRTPFDGPQLPGEEPLTCRDQPGVRQRGHEPAGLPHQFHGCRDGFRVDGPTDRRIDRRDLD
jgi:hypothetical protein